MRESGGNMDEYGYIGIIANRHFRMARIQQVESFGFANCRNGNIIAPVFNYVYEFSEGLAVVRLTEEQLTEHSISSDRTD